MNARRTAHRYRARSIVAMGSVAAALTLTGAAMAQSAPPSRILDQGVYYAPGSLDDGTQFRGDATISLHEADSIASKAASGSLGQVDLDHAGGVLVYKVDVGDQEVWVNASDGSVVSTRPQE